MKKILYLTGASGRDKWLYAISERLKSSSKAVFVCTDCGNKVFFEGRGIECYELKAFTGKKECDLKKIRFYENKYGLRVWDAWSVTFPRPMRCKFNREEVLSFSQYVMEKTEKILDAEKPDYMVCYGPAGYHHVLIYQMCKSKGVKIIELAHGKLRNRFTVRDNLRDRWPLLVKEYEKLKQGLTEDEKRKAENLQHGLINDTRLSQSEDKIVESRLNFFRRVVSYLWRQVRSGKIFAEFRHKFSRKAKHVYFNWLSPWSSAVKDEKFVFFPLHMQPEASTLIYGKWYVDQVALIENIAKSIPADHVLYVKEHPKNMGKRPMWYHKRIARLPNVKLLHPRAKTLRLIERCSCVATISGTAGFEALVRQKPVLVFGDVFYSVSSNVIKVKSPYEIPECIDKALSSEPSRNEVLRFLYALKNSTFPGLARLPGSTKGMTLKEENVARIANGIKEYLQRMYGKKF